MEESKVKPKLTFWSLFRFCVLVINQSISLILSCWILFYSLLLYSHAKFQIEKIIFSLLFLVIYVDVTIWEHWEVETREYADVS